MGRINISLYTRYPVAQELIIEANLAPSQDSMSVIAAAINCAALNAP